MNGRWTSADQAQDFAVNDPASGALVAQVAKLGVTETLAAIDAAHTAFAPWRDRLPQDRAVILHRWAALMLETREDLALLMTLEQGKPLAAARSEVEIVGQVILVSVCAKRLFPLMQARRGDRRAVL